MNVSLCDRFPALHPFAVRRERWSNVILIYRRLLTLRTPEPGANAPASGAFEHNGTVWKPSQSDDWW